MVDNIFEGGGVVNDDVEVLDIYTLKDQASMLDQGMAQDVPLMRKGAVLEAHFMAWYQRQYGQPWTQVYPEVAFDVVYSLYVGVFEAHLLETARLAMMTDGSLRWLMDDTMRCCLSVPV